MAFLRKTTLLVVQSKQCSSIEREKVTSKRDLLCSFSLLRDLRSFHDFMFGISSSGASLAAKTPGRVCSVWNKIGIILDRKFKWLLNPFSSGFSCLASKTNLKAEAPRWNNSLLESASC